MPVVLPTRMGLLVPPVPDWPLGACVMVRVGWLVMLIVPAPFWIAECSLVAGWLGCSGWRGIGGLVGCTNRIDSYQYV